MSSAPTPDEAMKQAAALLQQEKPPHQVEPLLQGIRRGDPRYAAAQHLRAIAAFRLGDAATAVTLLADAIRSGESTPNALLNLARAAGAVDTITEDIADLVRETLKRRVPADQLPAYTYKVFEDIGFTTKGAPARKKVVFDRIAMPMLRWGLECRLMDYSLMVETLAYERYVKSIETEAHFRQCLEQMAPPMTEAGRYWRDKLPPLAPPPDSAPHRVGFFVLSASTLAHIEVMLNTLKGYRQLATQPFEATVYCLGGKSIEMEQALAAIGIRLVMLNERYPADAKSPWRLILKLRELLAEERVHALVWVSIVTQMPLAFALRVAPVQVWWAMKYHSLELDDIDGYVTGGSISRYREIDGRQWRNGVLGVDDWYAPSLESEAKRLRATYGEKLVLGSIGRAEKLADPGFLAAIVDILRQNPGCVFLWPGREQDPRIQAAFEAAGVADRTFFIGWVNTRLYAQVVDVFLDSFPLPCGFTLFQAMSAGKPAVIYTSKEASETGLWAFIGPLLEGREGTDDERAALRECLYRGRDEPGIGIAADAASYVALANRLVRDAAWRAHGGEVSRALMQRYFSSNRVMGATYASHFAELVAARFPSLKDTDLKP